VDAETPVGLAAVPAGRRRLRKWRVPVLIVALMIILVGTRELNVLAKNNALVALVVGAGTAVAALACYAWLSRTVEIRPAVPEVSAAGRWSGLGWGALIGFAAFTATMAVIALFGGLHHVYWGSFGGFLVGVGAMASVAVNEELLFRGVVLRILEERAGTVIALAGSSLIFGLVHLVNADASLQGAIAIAIQGGVVLGAAYIVTQNLWLAIGFHFAWDVTEGSIFSTANSGTSDEPIGLLHTTLSGPTALTGGTFGPEGGLVAPLVCLVVAVFLLRRAARAGNLRRRPRQVGK
jgi:membrane protease YdiL (CAAX protease family)